MKSTRFIPKNNFNVWYELFKSSGGRFLANPCLGKQVYVYYEFEDIQKANEFEQEYQRLTTPITEKKRGFLKRIKSFLTAK